MALLSFGKKCHFMQKVLVFGKISELLITVLIVQTLGQSDKYFCQRQFWFRNVDFQTKKKKEKKKEM